MLMGAHEARLVRATKPLLIIFLALLIFLSSFVVFSVGDPNADALMKFKAALGNNMVLSNWNPSSNPCDGDQANWAGVLCLKGSVFGLQLEHMQLSGTIDVDALVSLPYFRTISLMNNNFGGSLPEFRKLGRLKALYLSNNKFSGDIPDDAFEDMGSLKRIYLANNEFTGKIPTSLTTMPKLEVLRLDGNQFEGQIPEFHQETLKIVFLASNNFEGPIPKSLSHMNPKTFSGNKDLCGPPLSPCGAAPAPSTTTKNGSNTVKIIIIVVVIGLVLLLLAVAMAMLFKKRNASQFDRTSSTALENPNKVAPSIRGGHDVQSKASVAHTNRRSTASVSAADNKMQLTFLRDDIEKFDLQDLLRASAEVLGSGTFGASYKAVVMSGKALVVKRYRHMNSVGREEFQEHMRRLGRLKHPNLLPLVAYYYRKEEKLLVTEFMGNGSLASHLHGKHSVKDQGLDWPTRLRIVKGVAKGLAYLYNELPIMVPHGHLKSANVLLNESFEPLLTDYALRPVINPEQAHEIMIAYKSPEYALQNRSSNKTDIWSFGILILEILTGKFPENNLTPRYDSNTDLASWVNNMVKEKKISEVFDKEMPGAKDSKGEMINLLKIGLSCCEVDVDRRFDIKEVMEKIEELTEGDHEGAAAGNVRLTNDQEDFSFGGMDR